MIFPKLSDESLILLDENKSFRVLLGTYLSWSEAEIRVKQIEGLPPRPSIRPRKLSLKETWYRVESGPFPNGEEALGFIRELREKRLLPSFLSASERDRFVAAPHRKKTRRSPNPQSIDQDTETSLPKRAEE
jgi:hypothetical protein